MAPKILVQISRPRIDEFFTNATMEQLSQLGEIIWNPHDRAFTVDELKEQISGADAVITTWGSTPITEDVVEHAPSLRLIAHFAGSVKPILDPVVYDHGVTVLNSNFAIAVSVSESVLALILAIGHKIVQTDHEMKNGQAWQKHDVFELRERTVGLIGLGLVAREVVKLLRPFGCNIIAHDPFVSEQTAKEFDVQLKSFHEVITQAEIISLHVPQVPETDHMFGEKELALIPNGTILINTARGSLFDEDALIRELKSGRLYAGLDVFDVEPLPLDSELRQLNNVIIRPHMAGVTPRSKLRIGSLMVEEIRRFFNGERLQFEVKRDQLARMT